LKPSRATGYCSCITCTQNGVASVVHRPLHHPQIDDSKTTSQQSPSCSPIDLHLQHHQHTHTALSWSARNGVHTAEREGSTELGESGRSEAPGVRFLQGRMPIPTKCHGNLQPARRRHRVPAPFNHRLRDPQELPRHRSQGTLLFFS